VLYKQKGKLLVRVAHDEIKQCYGHSISQYMIRSLR